MSVSMLKTQTVYTIKTNNMTHEYTSIEDYEIAKKHITSDEYAIIYGDYVEPVNEISFGPTKTDKYIVDEVEQLSITDAVSYKLRQISTTTDETYHKVEIIKVGNKIVHEQWSAVIDNKEIKTDYKAKGTWKTALYELIAIEED